MNYAVLLAGGVGNRISSDVPKQYIRHKGMMMITYSLKTLIESDCIQRICIVADPAWQSEISEDFEKNGIPKEKFLCFAKPGASSRQESILSGLEEIEKHEKIEDSDTVLVHDAARPFLTGKLLTDIYEALPGHDGVMPALPMKDTVYLSIDGKSISELLDRNALYAGQAPELFRMLPYLSANRALLPDKIKKINGSSEPAVLYGMDIAVIRGDEKNFKVTTNEDLDRFIRVIDKL